MDANKIIECIRFSPYSLFVLNQDKEVVVSLGKSFAADLGINADRFSGMAVGRMDIWARPEDAQRMITILNEEGALQKFETEFVDAHGKRFSYILTSTREYEGVVLISGHCNSDSKEVESALRYSKNLHKEAQKIAQLGHWELDQVSKELNWSDEIYRIFEKNPNKFVASYDAFLSMIHPDDRELVDSTFRKSLAEKSTYEVEHRLRMADGRIKFVREQGHNWFDEKGNPVRSMGTVQDITSFKEAENAKKRLEMQLRQSQKLEAIGTLVSGIAHDFNNILFSILGHAELALEKISSADPLFEEIQCIQEAGTRAKELVTQILTFSRKQPGNKQPVEVGLIIKEVLKLIRAALPPSISIHQSILSSKKVFGDSVQIHQVLMNLITNSAHAMAQQETGMLTVELDEVELDEYTQKFYTDLKPGRFLKIVVGDTGVGMPPEVQERIFEPFYTTKPIGTSTGLGLSVVHGIIKNHHGQILVYSEEGHGTTIKVLLPVVERPSFASKIAEKPMMRGDEKIFVVDDEPVLARLLKRMLASLGYSVESATDPCKALSLLKGEGNTFDLLITDMNMPGMSGVVLVDRLNDNGIMMPVIITSGLSDKINEKLVENKTVRKILQKPIVKKELALAVREALDGVASEPQHASVNEHLEEESSL